MTTNQETTTGSSTDEGVTMGWMPPRFYDVIMTIFTFGQEDRQRREILALADIQAGERVLDVGCGTGTMAILAADNTGAAEVLGVDPSKSMTDRARAKAGETRKNLSFQVGKAQCLPVEDNAFDVVLSSFTMHHLPGKDIQEQALAEMKRALTPGGRLLLVDLAGGHGHHHHHHPFHHCRICGGQDEQDKRNESPNNDPMVDQVKQAGFENVSGQSVHMMGGAVAVLARKPTKS